MEKYIYDNVTMNQIRFIVQHIIDLQNLLRIRSFKYGFKR